MKRKILMRSVIACLTLALSLVAAAAAPSKPNFGGTWVMDTSRSYGIPRDMKQTMTIVQTDDKIDLEVKIVTAQGERVVKDSYALDGKETEFTPQGPTGPAGKGKRTAKWLPDGDKLLISEETTVDTPKGAVTSQLTRKWAVSADGGTLTVDMYHDTPNGSFETKRIFVKQ